MERGGMMKYIGLCALFFGCAGFGFSFSKRYQTQRNSLQVWIWFVQTVQSKIVQERKTLGSIFASIQQSYLEETNILPRLRNGETLLDVLTSAQNEELRLPRCKEILMTFATSLGSGSISEESEKCEQALHDLQKLFAQLDAELPKQKRLIQTLSLSLGGVLVLLFL